MKKTALLLTSASEKISYAMIVLVAAIIPFILLPIGDSFFTDSKSFLFMLLGLILTAAFAIQIAAKKTVEMTLSPFAIPAGVLGLAVLLSSFFSSGFPLQHLLGFGGLLLSYAAVVGFGPTLLGEKKASQVFMPLTFGAVVLAVSSLLDMAGAGPASLASKVFGIQFAANTFNLSGSYAISAQLFVCLLVACIVGIKTAKGERKNMLAPSLVLGAISIVGAGVSVFRLMDAIKQNTLNLPLQVSWSIALETLKSVRSALFGIGPANYSHAYMQFKPEWVNMSPFWDLQFNLASNLPFTIVTTLGLLGLVAWVALLVQVIRALRKSSANSLPIGAFVLTSFIVELFFPPSVVILAIQAILMAFWIAVDAGLAQDTQLHTFTVSSQRTQGNVKKMPEHNHLLAYSTAGILALAVLVSGYWLTRFTLAQAMIFQANYQAIKRDAAMIYENQRKANVFYPYSDSFHRAYSSTNMAIAISLSNNKNITDDQKNQIVTLVQQAIREAKLATTFAPTNSVNWVNLARVYTNLIGVAKQSDSWALTAYAQASLTAPTDAGVQLEIGGLVYRLGQYSDSAKVFEKAVRLKPDWANAYYNLANAYKMASDSDKALSAYQQTLTLVGKDSVESKQVEKEVEELKMQIANKGKVGTKAPTRQVPPTPLSTPSATLAAPNATPSATFPPQTRDQLQTTPIEGP